MTDAYSIDTSVSKQTKKRNVVTTDIFIERAIAFNGDRYCYKKTIYKSYRDKLIVTCKKHGDIEVFPSTHLKVMGGCKGCNFDNNPIAVKYEDFLNRARAVHGDRYEYSPINYRGTKKKTDIVCSIHGLFTQTPESHMAGRGCNNCAHETKPRIRMTLLEFIARANATHGSIYDYSLVEYKNNRAKVDIICREHGVFKQTPSSHLGGNGCAFCSNNRTRGTAGFIEKAIAVHGETYGYSKVKYVRNQKKVSIECSEHGFFEQAPNTHLAGAGCPTCGGTKKLTAAAFINRSKQVHSDKYSYHKSKYKNGINKVVITCPIHGDFKQSPKSHMRGAGCHDCGLLLTGFGRSDFIRSCDKSMGGNGLLYVVRCSANGEVFYKVGITSLSVSKRFYGKGRMPYKYVSVFTISGGAEYIFDLEKRLHAILFDCKHTPSISFGGETECFSTIKPIENLLKRLSKTEQLQLIA